MLTITALETAGVELLPFDIAWTGAAGDFVLAGREGLRAADPIATAVVMLLFTDARGTDAQALRAEASDRRGWVGDGFDIDRPNGESELGSRLWLYRREALTSELAQAIEDEARRALQPLIAQQAAARIDVVATAHLDGPGNRLTLAIAVYGRDGTKRYADRFDILWDAARAL